MTNASHPTSSPSTQAQTRRGRTAALWAGTALGVLGGAWGTVFLAQVWVTRQSLDDDSLENSPLLTSWPDLTNHPVSVPLLVVCGVSPFVLNRWASGADRPAHAAALGAVARWWAATVALGVCGLYVHAFYEVATQM